MQEIKTAIAKTVKALYEVEFEPELSRPDEQHGDYSTNAALQLGKQMGKNPREVAVALAGQLHKIDGVADVQIAGPGFINLKLSDEVLAKAALAATDLPKPLAGQEILVEFGDANPFKDMHIGHLYSCIAGDAIARLLEVNGAEIKRLSYHGDVGLQVAKAIWGMQKAGPDSIDSDKIGEYYANGSKAYEEDDAARAEIDSINGHIYAKDNPAITQLYDSGRAKSLENFDKVYDLLEIKYDKHYFESESQEIGLKFVQEHRNVFKESDGAVIYEGEKAGLHTRVFITSKGLPTYETKDLGLTELKNSDYPKAARSIIVTGNEQNEYFKVMLAALAEIDAELAKKTTHLSHGFVSLTSGKMSSREGNVYTAMKLLLDVKDLVHAQYPDSAVRKPITFAAVKYAFLKHRLGSNIALDLKESISLEGSSGPYLQYAHARACSVVAKAGDSSTDTIKDLQPGERSLARKIGEYPEVVAKATAELMPHHVCGYLYELAQVFNRFYEANRVIGDDRQAERLQLVKAYAGVLKDGLGLLNIIAPEQV